MLRRSSWSRRTSVPGNVPRQMTPRSFLAPSRTRRGVCGAIFRCSSATTCHRRCGVFWRMSALSCRLHGRPPGRATHARFRAVPEGRLDSWKEIAAYLGRGIRTVQRWEREEGLPVHRLAHEKRGSIYARRDELARGGRAGDSRSPPPRPLTPLTRRLHPVSNE